MYKSSESTTSGHLPTAIGCSWIAYGRAASKNRMPPSTNWLRELAPSTQLREWFGHDPDRWLEFRKRYRAELRQHTSQLNALRHRAVRRRVTLIYSARDTLFNQAAVLKEVIQES